jgi:SprT protein
VEYVVNQTVPHEMAHLIAYAVFGTRIKPHGHEWKYVMRVLGKEPNRCHRLDTTSVRKVRKAVTRITFHCEKCRLPIQITQNRYTKMCNGKTYVHRGCGGKVTTSVVAMNRLY